MKLHSHISQYKFHEISFNRYLIMAEDERRTDGWTDKPISPPLAGKNLMVEQYLLLDILFFSKCYFLFEPLLKSPFYYICLNKILTDLILVLNLNSHKCMKYKKRYDSELPYKRLDLIEVMEIEIDFTASTNVHTVAQLEVLFSSDYL